MNANFISRKSTTISDIQKFESQSDSDGDVSVADANIPDYVLNEMLSEQIFPRYHQVMMMKKNHHHHHHRQVIVMKKFYQYQQTITKVIHHHREVMLVVKMNLQHPQVVMMNLI